VEYWSEAEIRQHFDFTAPGAIFTHDAAEIDPYELTHSLLQEVCRSGSRVFARTEVVHWECGEPIVRFMTDSGHEVRARWGVIAAGYESERFLPAAVASLRSTYAFASGPLETFSGWHDRCLIWETARPYLYLRDTDDNRLMAGGEDVPFVDEGARDRLMAKKVEAIASRVRGLFPRIDFVVDHSWAGTFAETRDGLPLIGRHPRRPGLLFALCYGGNGIPYAAVAAELLADVMAGMRHPLERTFAPDRPSLQCFDSSRTS
jgi:glycine/D-amino acid oxidase-like deaminating enzyme